MGAQFTLLGVKQGELEDVASALGRELGLEFQRRESSYKGGEYYRASSDQFEKVTVERNWEDEDGDLAEPDHPDFRVLAYLTSESASTLDVSEDFTLLSSEWLD